VVQVITASGAEWSDRFTGLQPGQFRKLVRLAAERGWRGDRGWSAGSAVGVVGGRPGVAGRGLLADEPDYAPDRPTVWDLARRTSPSDRYGRAVVGVGAGTQTSDRLAAIVDGTLVPTRDHRLAAPSKRTMGTRPTFRSRSTPTPAWSSPPETRNPATPTTAPCTATPVSKTRSTRRVIARTQRAG
jgi:hypothetical protein